MGGPIGLDSSDDDAAGCGAAANAMHARVLLGGGPTRPRFQAARQHPGIHGATIPGRAGAREGATDGAAGSGEDRTGERIEARTDDDDAAARK